MAIAKKKKRFYEVDIPIINKEAHLVALEKEELEGKFIKYDMTRILRGKGLILQSKVVLDGDKLTSVPVKITLLPFFMKRMVRKGTDYVEDSFSAECKEGTLKIKPLLIARRRISREVRKALRNKAREELVNYVQDKKSEDIFDDVLKNKLQKSLSLILKKVYPLSLCEIRVLHKEESSESKE